jgi:predicted tellurium resistance membrane protein TerC
VLEMILGIDNIIFISIITNKVKRENRQTTRVSGLLLVMFLRILMLFGLTWFIGLTKPFYLSYSIKDIMLFIGGVFLIIKSSHEISYKYTATLMRN